MPSGKTTWAGIAQAAIMIGTALVTYANTDFSAAGVPFMSPHAPTILLVGTLLLSVATAYKGKVAQDAKPQPAPPVGEEDDA